MCQVLGVDRSCYYHYRRQTDNRPPDPEHEEMLEWVQKIDDASDNTYGSRRMRKALNCLGYLVSRNKARKLMREAKVQVRHRKKFKVTPNSNHKQTVYDNLLQRQFDVSLPDQVLRC
jgi:putative transposase